MKRLFLLALMVPCLPDCLPFMKKNKGITMLQEAPAHSSRVHEISVEYPEATATYFNQLSLPEQIFVYYFWLACVPGNRIAADQHHRYALEIIALFELLQAQASNIAQSKTFDGVAFNKDVADFLVYLWTNHGQYFLRENGDEKRTPSTIGLNVLNEQTLRDALALIGYPNAQAVVDKLASTIFDPEMDKRMTTPDSIAESGVNIYGEGFTEQDYRALPDAVRKQINVYFYVDQNRSERKPAYQLYSATGKYAQELTVAAYWLGCAYDHAKKYPTYFDAAFVKSLDYLIQFVQTGDEELFKKHSIAWLASNSRIDYNFGFIEVYHDPKGRRGFFQAEATVKTVDMKKLNELLPSLEKKMPIPMEWKRATLGAMPNASMNQQLFGFGHLGPTVVTAAYCLPNYEEIRSQYGSKQIIYPAGKGLDMRIDPELARRLGYPKAQADWLITHDPEGAFGNDIWDVQCILHETLGHGSGKLGEHTFKEGEPLTIGEETYQVGQTIPVTNSNVTEFLAGYESTIEELRAEINALYVSINHLDELMSCGMMERWVKQFGKDKVIEWLILGMAGTGLRRILQQSDNATQFSGDHARANAVIMHYLIDHGGLSLVEEQLEVNHRQHTVIGLQVDDVVRTKALIEELMIKVQAIKSTGDGLAAQRLVSTYGTHFKKPEYIKILKENRKAIVGDLKAKALISPLFALEYDATNTIVGVKATWPNSVAEQFAAYRRLALSVN